MTALDDAFALGLSVDQQRTLVTVLHSRIAGVDVYLLDDGSPRLVSLNMLRIELANRDRCDREPHAARLLRASQAR